MLDASVEKHFPNIRAGVYRIYASNRERERERERERKREREREREYWMSRETEVTIVEEERFHSTPF